jgi:hypothetical protein
MNHTLYCSFRSHHRPDLDVYARVALYDPFATVVGEIMPFGGGVTVVDLRVLRRGHLVMPKNEGLLTGSI